MRQLRDGEFVEGVFKGKGQVDAAEVYDEEARLIDEERRAAAGRKAKPRGRGLLGLLPGLGRRKAGGGARRGESGGGDTGDEDGGAGGSSRGGSRGGSGGERLDSEALRLAAEAEAAAALDGWVFFELKRILVSRNLDKIASRALADSEEEVAQALERGRGLSEFARTMALQIEARFSPTRAIRF